MNVWECDLLDVQAYAKFNENHIYILSLIEVFSEFLHKIPVKTKSESFIALAFRSIFDVPKYSRRRTIWVRTDKGKNMFRNEGTIQFQVCRNPDLKCAVVERVHRTIHDRLYK